MNGYFLRAAGIVVIGLFSSVCLAGGILVVAPHPDDDLLIAAGVVANANTRGDQVKVVFMTNGDAYGGEASGQTRQNEAVVAQIQYLAAAEDDLIFLGYPDGGLQAIYNSYPEVTDVYWGLNNRSTTYGTRGLGRRDYHTFRFGVPALYNRANIVTDLRSIIDTYRPDHILTLAEYDKHSDHIATFNLLKLAIAAAVAGNPGYNPTIHKTLVWADDPSESPVWPERINPSTYHIAPPGLPAMLPWASRESIDVPASMQETMLSANLKYLALNSHVSQGGAASFLGDFVHKDEFFWAQNADGSSPLHVDAGVGMSASPGATVQLNGSGSFQPSGGALVYHWRQIGGTSVTLADSATATPSFVVPANLSQDEVMNFELTVSSGESTSLPDLVTVEVRAEVPNSQDIAAQAAVAASSQNTVDGQHAVKAIDGVADGYPGDYTREWATQGEGTGAWIDLRWSQPRLINRIVLFDRPNGNDHITSGRLTFSDGSTVPVAALNNDGAGLEVRFAPKEVTAVRFTVTSVSANTGNVGLSEIQVYSSPGAGNVNGLPVAVAGPHQAVASGSVVHLDGSASSDPEGAALAYNWRQTNGDTVTLSGRTTANPSFTAPAVTQDEVLSFELVVNDGISSSAPSTVNVTVRAALPALINVASQAIATASSENLADNQQAGKATDGIAAGYPGDYTREWATRGQRVGAWIDLRWDSQILISRIVLFDRPNVNDRITGGTLTFSDGTSLTIGTLNNDGSASTIDFDPRTVTGLRLTVTSVSAGTANVGLAELQVFGVVVGASSNQAPVANAGAAQTVAQGAAVQLNGGASSDPEGAPLTYRWRQVSGPGVALSSTYAVQPMFTAPTQLSQNATLSFELVVNDGQIDSLPSVVNVMVAATATVLNLAPQATTILCSSENAADGQLASKAVDTIIGGYPGDYTREWATRGERSGAWIELRWSVPIVLTQISLYDRPNTNDQIRSGTLLFSDGTTVAVGALNNDGSATPIDFAPRTVTSVRFTVSATSDMTFNAGLSEFEVLGSAVQ